MIEIFFNKQVKYYLEITFKSKDFELLTEQILSLNINLILKNKLFLEIFAH